MSDPAILACVFAGLLTIALIGKLIWGPGWGIFKDRGGHYP